MTKTDRIEKVREMCKTMDLSNYYFQAIRHAIIIKRIADLGCIKRFLVKHVVGIGGFEDYEKMEYFFSKEGEINLSEDSVEELREICQMIINNEYKTKPNE